MAVKKIKTGSDFSGVGAFDQALKRLNIEQDKKFACDWDKYVRQTYILNYGEPIEFPCDVYERKIPNESLDLYMTSPPCQAFSMAGKRLGKEDERGILFFNSFEFIEKNKPRYFIFENVKGLVSHEKTNPNSEIGNTFQEWLNHLGGKSINGMPIIFPYEKSVPYHVYWFVLNAKEHGIPQNRERVFIVGIRDEKDNFFEIPKPFKLKKTLKDCLDENVDEKYFLSDSQMKLFINQNEIKIESKNYPSSFIFEDENIDDLCLKIKANTKKGFDILTTNDSINLSVPSSKTRRGRIGKNVAQTLDTNCNQGVLVLKRRRTEEGKEKRKSNINSYKYKEFYFKEQNIIDTIIAKPNHLKEGLIFDKRIRKLTPRECFRLMDFPEDFTWNVSDSQAYKQAGNSIPVGMLVEIIKKLNFE